MSPFILLGVAIVSEVIGTLALRSADGFTKLLPSVVTIVGYAIAFYFLSLTLKTIPVGIAYAIWSGMGVVLVSILAYFLYKQSLDLAGIVGIGLIVSGVIVLNVFSKASAH